MPLRADAVTAILTLTAISTGLGLWQWYRKRKVYVKIGKVEKLFFYPFKSLKGIEVDEISCTARGAKCFGIMDRTFMLINDNGTLVSQRDEPSMVLLRPEVKNNELLIHDGENKPLVLPIEITVTEKDNVGKIIPTKIHADDTDSIDCGDEAAKWFQRFLKRSDIRVVRFSYDLPNRKHIRRNNPFISKITKDFPVTFQDFAAFHILSQSSIDDLVKRITTKVSSYNFRPNILLSGPPPYDEDHWKYLKFANAVELIILLPCGRCLLTTNDPETGIKSDKEPLVTLRKFRMSKDSNIAKHIGHSPGFGVNGWLKKAGNIRVGDDIFVVREQDRFKF